MQPELEPANYNITGTIVGHIVMISLHQFTLSEVLQIMVLLPFNVQRDGEQLVFHPNGRTVQETSFFDFILRVLDQ